MFHKLVIFFEIFLAFEMVLGGDSGIHAVQYTDQTFPIEMAKKDHFVMFYAPWCRHSQRLTPIWEQLAARIDGIKGGRVQIAKVDCATDKRICNQNSITMLPTLKFFKAGESPGFQYEDNRDLESLTGFVKEIMASIPVSSATSPY